ncbi:MAG: M20 family metallo-hydrolase [Candidatus Thermoplasmatota archaeon]|nr:M20 family metallo-hydrolase [Candidatus Thermoplasmatota archaeon]
MPDMKKIESFLKGSTDDMIEFARDILSIPAIAPGSGGDGEMKKAQRILELVSDWGFDGIERYDAPDERVTAGKRPNILLRVRGDDPSLPRIWLFAHLDVVPPGDLNKWTGDPYTLRVDGDRLIARGIEDNGQDLIASLFAARALLESGARPKRDINIFLVADEEVGSEKGMVYLLKEHEGLFSRDDLFIVPDAGEPDGSMIEVAEKSIMWIKVTTFGKQVHASVPHKGINANLAAMRFLVDIHDELNDRYPHEDLLYDYPRSSFVPSKREANVPNINTVPGEDISYIDCRIMPHYRAQEVLDLIRTRAEEHSKKHGVRMEVETVQYEQAAPPTSPDHHVVGMLKEAIREVYGVEAKPQGIGGGTCAAILRRRGYPAAVWGKMEETAHMPDETALLSNYMGDSRVFARIFMS